MLCILVEYFKKLTSWYVIYTSCCNLSLFFLITNPLCFSLCEGVFFLYVVVFLVFSFFLNMSFTYNFCPAKISIIAICRA